MVQFHRAASMAVHYYSCFISGLRQVDFIVMSTINRRLSLRENKLFSFLLESIGRDI